MRNTALYRLLFLTACACCSFWAAPAQLVTIADSCLKVQLLENHPQFFNNGLLDTTVAKNYYGSISLRNGCLTHIEELVYFKNISSIDLNNNQITDIAPLLTMPNLRFVMLNKNDITNASPLLQLPSLKHLEISYNPLTKFPTSDTTVALEHLYCYQALFTTIPTLDFMPKLITLVLNENKLDSLPPLAKLTQLRELHISGTNIRSIPDLETLALTRLFCERSAIQQLSGLEHNTTLQLLSAYNTQLSALPKLLNKPLLTNLNVSNNRLTFEDVAILSTHPHFNNFVIAPQQAIFVNSSLAVREQTGLQFQTKVDESMTEIVSSWFRNDTLLSSSGNPTHTINHVNKADQGRYRLTISYAPIPHLLIYSETWQVEVLPCLALQNTDFTIVSQECTEGATIHFQQLEVASDNPPFHYELVQGGSQEVTAGSTAFFEKIAPGNYQLRVTDQRQCSQTIALTVNKPTDCQDVFSPNGDGIMDTYFVETPGKTQILNRNRQVIYEFNTPGTWNGRSTSGEEVPPGMYIVVTNNNTISTIHLVK